MIQKKARFRESTGHDSKKITAILLAAVLILSMGPVGIVQAAAANTNQIYINYVVAKKWMSGYADGFRADKPMNRGEFAGALCKMTGASAVAPAKSRFKDVVKKNPYAGAIETAARNKWMAPRSGVVFVADKPITRAELASALMAASGAGIPAVSLPKGINDLKGNVAANAIAAALDAGMMKPMTATTFAPAVPATRGQIARGLAVLSVTAARYRQMPLAVTLTPVKGGVQFSKTGKVYEKLTKPVACAAGTVVKTGAGGEAELKFPDGSDLLLKENTVIWIKNALGQAVIKTNGQPGTAIDQLQVSLTEGRIHGALAKTGNAAGVQDTARLWWKQASAEKVRVQVDMPWGVCGIRGTIWSNIVSAAGQITSVVSGAVQVTSASVTVDVGTGQETSIASAAAPPSAPTALSADEQKAWDSVNAWVTQTTRTMDSNKALTQAEITAPGIEAANVQGLAKQPNYYK